MIIETCGSRFHVDSSTGYPGYWEAVETGRWEPETLAAIAALVDEGTRFVDIGAWIGPTSLFAAAAGAVVDAYEPDSVAREGLQANLSENPDLRGRITVHPYALARSAGRANLAARQLGQSVSSLMTATGESEEVELVAFSSAAESGPLADADVVKLDIEGGEYPLLADLGRFLRRRSPVLILSTHVQHLRERLPAGLPRPIRLAALQVLALGQLRVLWHLRDRRYWYEPAGRGWRQLRRRQVALRLVRFSEKEFVVAARPLSLP